MSLLDTVEPDCWRKNESVQWDSRIHTTIMHKSEFPEKVARLFNSPLYSRETVESLLSQCRKEALLEAAEECGKLADIYDANAAKYPESESHWTVRSIGADDCQEGIRRMAESDKTTMEGEKE